MMAARPWWPPSGSDSQDVHLERLLDHWAVIDRRNRTVCSPNPGPIYPTSASSISIVDDDAQVRKSLTNLLSSVGYLASGFDCGEAFMASLGENSPDCVLVDSRMNGMQGIDVQRQLKSSGIASAVVCMSAFWDDAARQEACQWGAHACLSKPFSEELLLSTLNDALSAKKAAADQP